MPASNVTWKGTYRYVGSLSNNKFTVKLNKPITSSWKIYLGFSSAYAPYLSTTRSIDVEINNLPTNYKFIRPRLLLLEDLPFT